MMFPSRETVKQIRNEFPKGTRVELVSMDDRQAPPPGSKGTVIGVDDTGSLLMRWDNGSGLNVVYGEDVVQKLKTVKTICYGEEKIWDSRKPSGSIRCSMAFAATISSCRLRSEAATLSRTTAR